MDEQNPAPVGDAPRTEQAVAMPRMLQTRRLILEAQGTGRFGQWLAMERARDEAGHADLAEDDAWLRLLARAGCWSAFGIGLYFLIDRQGGEMVGEAGLQLRRRGLGPAFDGLPEASWAISADHQRQGLALEAMGAVLAALDRSDASSPTANQRRIVALISQTNAASRTLADRLGFAPFAELSYLGEPHGLFERSTSAIKG